MTSQGRGKRILVVDDDRLIVSLLEAGLQELEGEYTIMTAFSGQEALAKIGKEMFALVMTDYQMPDMNGVELMQQIRHLSPETRIVLMSAHPPDLIETKIGEIRADGYLEKPISLTKLWVLTEEMIDNR